MYASEPRGAHARLGLAAGREVTCFGAHERTCARLGLSGEPFAFLQRRRAAVKHTSANTIMKPSTQDPRRRTRAADLVQCVYHPTACVIHRQRATPRPCGPVLQGPRSGSGPDGASPEPAERTTAVSRLNAVSHTTNYTTCALLSCRLHVSKTVCGGCPILTLRLLWSAAREGL
jgi:hypothetical protein